MDVRVAHHDGYIRINKGKNDKGSCVKKIRVRKFKAIMPMTRKGRLHTYNETFEAREMVGRDVIEFTQIAPLYASSSAYPLYWLPMVTVVVRIKRRAGMTASTLAREEVSLPVKRAWISSILSVCGPSV